MTPDRLAEILMYADAEAGAIKFWPEAARELVAEVEKLSAIVDELADAHKSAHEDWSKIWAERDAARAEVRRLTDGITALADERDKAAEESLSRMLDGSPFPALVSTGELRALLPAPPTPTEGGERNE